MEWNETPLIVRSQREVLMELDPAEFWGITQEERSRKTSLIARSNDQTSDSVSESDSLFC